MRETSQARTLGSIAISFSRGSSLPRDQYQGEETLMESNLPGSGSRGASSLELPRAQPAMHVRDRVLPGTCTWRCSLTSGSARSPACPCSAAAAAPAHHRNTALSEMGLSDQGQAALGGGADPHVTAIPLDYRYGCSQRTPMGRGWSGNCPQPGSCGHLVFFLCSSHAF